MSAPIGGKTSDRPDGFKVSFMETDQPFSTLVRQTGKKLSWWADREAAPRG
jgi:hypothetical protein